MLDAAYSQSGTLYETDSITGELVLDAAGDPIPLETGGGTELTYQRCMDGDYEIIESKTTGNTTTETVLATVTGYEDSTTYAGYFQSDQWYEWKWNSGSYAYSSWQSGKNYTVDDRVYDYGNIYVATSTGTSSGDSVDQDAGVDWDSLFYLSGWNNDTVYAAGTFVWYENQLYYTAAGGTSSDIDDTDGLKLSDDTGITDWIEVDSTWLAKSYTAGDIVTYKGVYYEALSDIDSTDSNPGEDAGVKWQSLRQGAFEEIDVADACSGGPEQSTKRQTHSVSLLMKHLPRIR